MSDEVRKIRLYIFLSDVLWLAVSAYGGPQAHLAMFLDILVRKRAYLTEEELLELNALCQVLPGPSSTQTIIAVAYKRSGVLLASLTLLVWALPAVCVMISFALAVHYFESEGFDLGFTRFIGSVAVGFVAYGALRISTKVIKTKTAFVLMLFGTAASLMFRSPWSFPLILALGGCITAFKFKNQEREHKEKMRVRKLWLMMFFAVFLLSAGLGGLTQSLPVRLFENFYRNGSLIFGGGQVLVPALHTEFVTFKNYLSAEEFLTGYGMVQAVPGPTFSFSAYVGALSMRDYGIIGEALGGLIASAAIFLPGMFLIFFLLPFWESLKRYRVVKASLEGINAASAGMVIAAVCMLFGSAPQHLGSFFLMLLTFLLLQFTKTPAPLIVAGSLLFGLLI